MMTRRMSAAFVVLGLLGASWADPTAQTTAAEVAALRQQAEQGDASAQVSLGDIYVSGRGVPQDYVEAARWTRLAADQGHAGAQSNLGFMYGNGQGVAQDYTEAARWYRNAADQGHSYAQYNLGVMYGSGRGVPQDFVEAHKWVNLAASRVTGDDQKRFAERRDALGKAMTSVQTAEAQQRASEWQSAFDARQE